MGLPVGLVGVLSVKCQLVQGSSEASMKLCLQLLCLLLLLLLLLLLWVSTQSQLSLLLLDWLQGRCQG
jgi:hypothetical protein